MTEAAPRPRKPNYRSRGFWLRQLHTWHWISSAACLVGLLGFAITGITLNHAGQIDGDPRITDRKAVLPAPLLHTLPPLGLQSDARAPLPAPVRDWASATLTVKLPAGDAEWRSDEIYLALPRPGGDAWLSIDRISGETEYQLTERGWISWLNDLHKGRNTGDGWRWFIDAFAVACLIFAGTGLVILQMHARHRRSTWPLVGAGLAIPVLLIVLLIH